MAHRRLIAATALAVLGCGSPARAPSNVEASPAADARPRPVDAFASAPSTYGRFTSKRFSLTLPLPDGKTWRIDDHAQPLLVATHEASGSRVELAISHEDAVMTRASCEARARAHGLVADPEGTLEDQAIVAPGPYDTRVWVGTRAGGREGHVYAFGGSLRTCFFFHFLGRAEEGDPDALPRRLAVARERVLGGITVKAARTDEDLTLPRARPREGSPRARVP